MFQNKVMCKKTVSSEWCKGRRRDLPHKVDGITIMTQTAIGTKSIGTPKNNFPTSKHTNKDNTVRVF